MRIRHAILVFAAFALLGGVPAAAEDGCAACHGDPGFQVTHPKHYRYFQNWTGSVHDAAGVSCSACHGGSPDAKDKETAHRGILPAGAPESPLYYRNIPETCGSCHGEVREHFVKSKHYQRLMSAGKGPHCAACHGSMNSKSQFTRIVAEQCASCHNAKTGNHPDVVAVADRILRDQAFIDGYWKGLRMYYARTGERGPVAGIEPQIDALSKAWHEFDFKTLEPLARDLSIRLKVLYNQTLEERRKKDKKE